MAEAAIPMRSESSTPGLEVAFRAKILNIRKFNGQFYTVVAVAAKDEYSRPQYLSVRSKNHPGAENTVRQFNCELGGFMRKGFETKPDRNTGETSFIVPVEHTLVLIES